MTALLVLFGLGSGCLLSILVGLLGRGRKIGFSWAFFWSLILTPFVGLIITLLSDQLPRGEKQDVGCLGTIIVSITIVTLLILAFFIFTALLGAVIS